MTVSCKTLNSSLRVLNGERAVNGEEDVTRDALLHAVMDVDGSSVVVYITPKLEVQQDGNFWVFTSSIYDHCFCIISIFRRGSSTSVFFVKLRMTRRYATDNFLVNGFLANMRLLAYNGGADLTGVRICPRLPVPIAQLARHLQ